MEYNLLVLFLIFLSFLEIFCHIKNKNAIYVILLITYCIFFGLRGFVAWDWYNYYPEFLRIHPIYEITKINFEGEFLYKFLQSFFKIFSNNYHTYIFFTTLIEGICLFLIFKKYSPYPCFSMLLFIGLGGVTLQFDLMRNIKSLIISLFSLQYVYERRFFKYSVMNIVASFIHISSIVFLPLYCLLKKNIYKNKKILIFVFAFGIFTLFFFNNFLFKLLEFIKNSLIFSEIPLIKIIVIKIDTHLETFNSSVNKLGINFIEKLFISIFIFKNKEKIIKFKYGNIFLNMFFIYIFLYFYGNGVKIIFQRLGLIFISSYWILLPMILKKNIKLKKFFLFCFISLFCLIKINHSFVFKGIDKQLYEYKNILFTNETYEEKKIIYEQVLNKFNIIYK